jgi:hypothetical protein
MKGFGTFTGSSYFIYLVTRSLTEKYRRTMTIKCVRLTDCVGEVSAGTTSKNSPQAAGSHQDTSLSSSSAAGRIFPFRDPSALNHKNIKIKFYVSRIDGIKHDHGGAFHKAHRRLSRRYFHIRRKHESW